MIFSCFEKPSTEDAPRESALIEPQRGPKSALKRAFCWLSRLFRRTNRVVPSPQTARVIPQARSEESTNSGAEAVFVSPSKSGPGSFTRTHSVTPSPAVAPAQPPRLTGSKERLSEEPHLWMPFSGLSDGDWSGEGSVGEPVWQVKSIPKEEPQFMGAAPRKRVALARCGLPNGGNTCYQNACLQLLRTAEPFMGTISSQEKVWRHCEEAELLRHIHAIAEAPYTPGSVNTYELLYSFKQAVAVSTPEFGGFQQQDAHEFLMVLMEQIQKSASILQGFAFNLEVPYFCPVEEHMMFHMDNIRTCRRCGQGSSRREAFSVLSLDLFPGWSVKKLLDHHLKETELEFNCDCGGQLSSQTTAFSTLPNVLFLHLKRFTYDSNYKLEKVDHPVGLDRRIVLKSREDRRCFNLSGIISHLGRSVGQGHYISDGVDLEDRSLLFDRWLTYNDSLVSRSTGKDCSSKRERTAYILMYQWERI